MSVNKEKIFYKCLDEVNRQIEKHQAKLDEISGYNEENNMHPDFDEYGNKGEMFNTYEQHTSYLDNAQKMKETLVNLDTDLTHRSTTVGPGSLVETEEHYYYISVPLGEVDLDDGSRVYAISTEAPIYQELENLKEGDSFTFDGKERRIVGIY